MLQTGGMCRVGLRGRESLWVRYLIHACAFNLSLVMGKLYQAGTPRSLKALLRAPLRFLLELFCTFTIPVDRKRLVHASSAA